MVMVATRFNYQRLEKDGTLFITSGTDYLFRPDQLTDLQVKMLQMNNIPNIAPIQVEEINLEVRLRYNISRKIPLNEYLSRRKMDSRSFYQLLLKITKVLLESPNYMLVADQFIIDEKLIFIGNQIDDLSLIYLPIHSKVNEHPVKVELKELITNLIIHVDLSGQGYQEVIRVLNNPNSTLETLKELLEGFLSLAPVNRVEPTTVMEQKVHNEREVPSSPQQESIPPKPKQIEKKQSKPVDKLSSSRGHVEEETTKTLNKLSERERIYMFGGALVAIAFIWKFIYLSIPSEGSLYVSIGLSILVADLVFILMKVWRPWGMSKNAVVDKQYVSKEEVKQKAKSKGKQKAKAKQAVIGQNDFVAKETKVEQSSYQPEKKTVSTVDYYSNLNNETEILGVPKTSGNGDYDIEETTLLNPNYPYLEVTKEGHVARADIVSNRFVIGRNDKEVDFVINGIGVSRTHFEISNKGGAYYIKDLGSSNGTKLNHTKLPPYQEHELKNGDAIQFAKESCVFKTE
jgi:hypothetical protein